MRSVVLVYALAASCGLHAQLPPIDVQWTAMKWYGSGMYDNVPLQVCFDGDWTGWLISDDELFGSLYEDGVIRYYGNGLQTEFYPYAQLSCGSLTTAIRLVMRNDSVFGLTRRQYVGGDQNLTYCLFKPGGAYLPQPLLPSGAWTNTWVMDLLLDDEGIHITAGSDSVFNTSLPKHQRLTSWSPGGTLLWDTIYPTQQFREFSSIVRHNGLLAVADFPFIHWFDPANGDLMASLQVHPGAEGSGDLEVKDGELYWASHVGNTLHYGKLDATGNSLWSGSLEGGRAMFIAVDDLHRLWIAPGHSITPGTIYRVASDGSVLEAYFYGDNIRCVTCQDGKIAITGKWQPNSNASFLVVGTPQP